MKNVSIFLDSNVILTGTFFSGPESVLLSLTGFDFMTADICLEEVLAVVRRKFRKMGPEAERIVIDEVKRSFSDMKIIQIKDYRKELEITKNLVKGKNDQKVLAAVLHVKPDFFVTGDKDFHTKQIKKLTNVVNTSTTLNALRR